MKLKDTNKIAAALQMAAEGLQNCDLVRYSVAEVKEIDKINEKSFHYRFDFETVYTKTYREEEEE